ncbi:hypothetical protein MTO96_034016 [Rhipicephalus appendiculatus]
MDTKLREYHCTIMALGDPPNIDHALFQAVQKLGQYLSLRTRVLLDSLRLPPLTTLSAVSPPSDDSFSRDFSSDESSSDESSSEDYYSDDSSSEESTDDDSDDGGAGDEGTAPAAAVSARGVKRGDGAGPPKRPTPDGMADERNLE